MCGRVSVIFKFRVHSLTNTKDGSEMRYNDKPDFVVNLGDAILDEDEDTDRANYQLVIKRLEKTGVPVYSVIGNHDSPNIGEQGLRDLLRSDLYYSFDYGSYHFIVLYSRLAEQRYLSEIDAEQIDWLRRDLMKTDKKTVVFSHHSLANQSLAGNFWFEDKPEDCSVQNRREIRSILEGSGRVIAALNGHLHWNNKTVHNGIPYFTLQSLVENVNDDGEPSKAYGIVRLAKESIIMNVGGNYPEQLAHRFSN